MAQHALRHGDAGRFVPNFADTGNRLSIYTSFLFLDELLARSPEVPVEEVSPGIEEVAEDVAVAGLGDAGLQVVESGQEFGSKLENKLAEGLRAIVAHRGEAYHVASKGNPSGSASLPSFQLTDYWPYASPPTASEGEEARETYRQMGRGHLIQPDVLIWSEKPKTFARVIDSALNMETIPMPQLLACISGKATIRSDRSQSSRYEGTVLSRWRRGRAPHFLVVTAEPLPSRIGSLAWGLGEIDCVYHVHLPSLVAALAHAEDAVSRNRSASNELARLVDHARLRDISQLEEDLFNA